MGTSNSPFQNPTVQCRPADFHTAVPLQHRVLSIQRLMIAILADHHVDHNLITSQALLDDSWGQRSRDHTLLLARLAGALLAFADQHEILRRLHIQLGALLVADHCRLFPAAFADTLLGRARQDPLYPRKVCRQFLPPWMLALRLRRGLDRRAPALRLDFHTADSRLQFQQLQLRIRKLFAAWPVLRDADQSQSFLQHADLQFRILQLVLIREDGALKIAELIAHRCKQRPSKLFLQLFDQFKLGRHRRSCGSGPRRWMSRLTHDEFSNKRSGLWITSVLCGSISFGVNSTVPSLALRLRQIDSTQ